MGVFSPPPVLGPPPKPSVPDCEQGGLEKGAFGGELSFSKFLSSSEHFTRPWPWVGNKVDARITMEPHEIPTPSCGW